MTPVIFIIEKYLECKDMTKDALIKELYSIEPHTQFAHIHHETIVYLLSQLKENEADA